MKKLWAFFVVAAAVFAAMTSGGGFAASAPSRPSIVIRVDSLKGRDGAFLDQVPTQPVATLARALALASRLRSRHADLAVIVELAPGIHRLQSTLHLGPEDGGTNAAPVVIRGAPGGRSSLWGSVTLVPIRTPIPLDIVDRMPPLARGHVKLYKLPAAALDSPTALSLSLLNKRPAAVPLEIYDQKGALVPARWPNQGWARVAGLPDNGRDPVFIADAARLARWRREPDLWAEGFWRWDWLFESLPVTNIDVAERTIRLSQMPYEGIRRNARYRISHALSELDAPGEWWRDEARGLLVAWPRTPDARLELAVAANLLDIERSRHLRIENLDLEHSRGDLVVVRNARDVVLRQVTFAWAGARGVAFAGSEDSGIEDCDLDGLGAGAASLEGGDRVSLIPSGLFVRRSRFSDYMRLNITQGAAVELAGVGASVEHSLFHDASTSGILIHGNDHRIYANELTRLLAEKTDAGAIYTGRDWTARGTVIEGNYLHDIRADKGFEVKGIYLDDFASGLTIRRNLFVNVQQPVFVGGGQDNVVTGNVFVASSPAIHLDSRGQTWLKSSIDDPESELRAAYRGAPTDSRIWRERYPGLAGMLGNEPAVSKGNRITDNTFVLSVPFEFTEQAQRRRQTIDGNVGPDQITSASGTSLPALVARGRNPSAFADLVDATGRPVGIDLGPALRKTPR